MPDIRAPKSLIETLQPIVSGGDTACLNSTPMIPLHKDTVASILFWLERPEALKESLDFEHYVRTGGHQRPVLEAAD